MAVTAAQNPEGDVYGGVVIPMSEANATMTGSAASSASSAASSASSAASSASAAASSSAAATGAAAPVRPVSGEAAAAAAMFAVGFGAWTLL